MKKISFILVLLGFHLSTWGQTDADALRYSMLNYGSTARSLGMSNAFGALGADFSSLSSNPAGIALYRRSEFTISPLFSNRTLNTNYLDQNNSDNYFKFSFGNLGMVWASNRNDSKSNWKGMSFGIGYNRLNDFSGRYTAEGMNGSNSLLDNYLQDLEGVDPKDIPDYFPYDINLAWQTYLIDTASVGGQLHYFSAVPFAGTKQTKSIETKGGQGEWDFTFGGNFDEKLYIGFTLGITSLRYVEESSWEEKDSQDTIPGFTSYTYNQNLKTNGSGLNFKLGAIYRASDAIRLGLAIHSPTWYTLVDEYSANIKTDLQDGSMRNYSGPEFIPFDYTVATPFRILSSFGLIVGKQGLFNVDYEYLNYNQACIKPVDKSFASDFKTVNNALSKKYTGTHQVRAGFEFRLDEFRIRTGGFFSTSPFRSDLRDSKENDLSKFGVSAGFGFRQKRFFYDLAYSWSKQGSFIQPYALNNINIDGITIKQTDNRILMTFGVLF